MKLKMNATLVILLTLHFMSARKNIVLKKQMTLIKMMKKKLI